MRNTRGHTLPEVLIAAAIIFLLVAVGLSIASESMKMAAFAEADFRVQHEANRSFRRLTEVLRETGWNSEGSTTFPEISVDRTELRFRQLADLDGNGYAFDETTGELEWGAMIYTLRIDPDEKLLAIFDATDERVLVLGRYIDSVEFRTHLQDPTLHRQEVRVTIRTEKLSPDGDPLTFISAGSIHLRK